MKNRRYFTIFVFSMLLALITPCLAAEQNSGQPTQPTSSGQASLGIRIDTNPLPELLIKHLRLDPDQGLLIANVLKGGPADQAELEQDDVIIGFQGKPVKDFDEFVKAVRAAGVGAAVSVEAVHLGQRKTVAMTLSAWPETQTWKYADRDVTVQRHQPGRVFRIPPGQRHWQQVPYHQAPEMKDFLQRFYRNQYSYRSSDGRLDLEIIIDGNPRDNRAKITVHDKKTNTDYHATVARIDQLPEQFRSIVQDTVKSAKRTAQPLGNDSFDAPCPNNDITPSPFDDQAFQNQLRDMRERLEQMERQYQDMHDGDAPQAPPSETPAPEEQNSQPGGETEYM